MTFKIISQWHHTWIPSVKDDSEANRSCSSFGSHGASGGSDFISASSHSAVVWKDAAASTAHTRTASPLLATWFCYTQVTPTSKYSFKNITEKTGAQAKLHIYRCEIVSYTYYSIFTQPVFLTLLGKRSSCCRISRKAVSCWDSASQRSALCCLTGTFNHTVA